jgi:hypothetical protein
MVICFALGPAVVEIKAAGASSQERKVADKKGSKKDVYEFDIENPAFRLFFAEREIDYLKNKIRTADEWIPKLKAADPKANTKKLLAQLQERQAILEKQREKYVKQAAESKFVFQKPYIPKGTILLDERDILSRILLQAAGSRQSALTDECPEDFYMYSSVDATEFREYKSTATDAGTNTFSEWILRKGASTRPITEADTLRFEAYAFPIPEFIGESINLKFL